MQLTQKYIKSNQIKVKRNKLKVAIHPSPFWLVLRSLLLWAGALLLLLWRGCAIFLLSCRVVLRVPFPSSFCVVLLSSPSLEW